jgi:hypothetical protein
MTFGLSKALKIVCYLWAFVGLILVGLAVAAVVLHRYDGPVTFLAGAFFWFFALLFFFLSRSKILTQPIVAGILWAAVVLFGIWGIWGLFNILVSVL